MAERPGNVFSNQLEVHVKGFKTSWLTRVAVFALALSVFAACSDDETTGPTGDVDQEGAAAALDGLVGQFVEGNEALESLGVLSPFITGALQGNVAALAVLPKSEHGGIYGWARSMQLSVTELRASSDGPDRIPVGALGKTFVYNPEIPGYEIDETRTKPDQAGCPGAEYEQEQPGLAIVGRPDLVRGELLWRTGHDVVGIVVCRGFLNAA